MWSSAATRRLVEDLVAHGHPERVIAYSCSFLGMVLPGEKLSVSVRHVGMRKGNMVVRISTTNDRGEKVIEGSAEVIQPPTVYTFTGQGSQERNMGMELYATSPAARAVWDAADGQFTHQDAHENQLMHVTLAHLLSVYGLSILQIVRDNPMERTVHFGGTKGQAIRQRYMDMTYDTADKEGIIKTL